MKGWEFMVVAVATVAVAVMTWLLAGVVVVGAIDLGEVDPFGLVRATGVTLALTVLGLAVGGPVAIGTALWVYALAPLKLRRPSRRVLVALSDVPPLFWGVAAVLVLPRLPGVPPAALAVFGLAAVGAPAIARRALRALDEVPARRMVAAQALGLDPALALTSSILPSAGRGLVRALLLGFSRSLGDCVILIVLVAGLPGLVPLPVWAAGSWPHIGRPSPEGVWAALLVWSALAFMASVAARSWTRGVR